MVQVVLVVVPTTQYCYAESETLGPVPGYMYPDAAADGVFCIFHAGPRYQVVIPGTLCLVPNKCTLRYRVPAGTRGNPGSATNGT
eukprot:2715849-Rhodomonas_salina.2